METRIFRAVRYRNKAEEICTMAESMKEPRARAMMLSVARDYIAIAKMLEKHKGANVPGPCKAKQQC